ncbi:MAG: 5-formyltetrahydrofolate cyclo-ligase [Thermodesulfobacteriota bacterium]
MDDIKQQKLKIRQDKMHLLEAMPEAEVQARSRSITGKLYEFANFFEAQVVLLFIDRKYDIDMVPVMQHCIQNSKTVLLPVFDPPKHKARLFRVSNPRRELIKGLSGMIEPNPAKCKEIALDHVDVAILPGLAFDEKGGRLGYGEGRYDRLIARLPITTRKVAVAFEDKIVAHVPMESHDRYVDIILTDKRTIYKI